MPGIIAHDGAEAEVAHAGVDHLGPAGGGPVGGNTYGLDVLAQYQEMLEDLRVACEIQDLPFDGVVVSRQVDVGQFVGPGTPLATVFSTEIRSRMMSAMLRAQSRWARRPASGPRTTG